MGSQLPEEWQSPYQVITSTWKVEIIRIINDLPEFRILKIHIRRDHPKAHRLQQSMNVYEDCGVVIFKKYDKHNHLFAVVGYPFIIKKRLFRSPKIIWVDVTSDDEEKYSFLCSKIEKENKRIKKK